MKRSLPGLFIGIGLFVILATCPPSTSAQQAAGFSVSPAQISFTIKSDEPTKSATISITNSYATPLHLTADLQSIDELGVRLLPNGPVDQQLGRAIKLSATDITVPAKATSQLQVAVDSTLLADGGHYASLVLSQRAAVGLASGVRSAVAVNLFIIKADHIRTDLKLTDISFDRPFLSLPKSATITVKNNGNTHIVPRGSVILYDGQDIVSKGVMNLESGMLFPGQSEVFKVKIDTYTRYWLPHRLLARTMYRIDGSDIQLIDERAIWCVPFVDWAFIAALLVGGWRWRKSLKLAWQNSLVAFKKLYIGNTNKHKPGKGKRAIGSMVLRHISFPERKEADVTRTVRPLATNTVHVQPRPRHIAVRESSGAAIAVTSSARSITVHEVDSPKTEATPKRPVKRKSSLSKKNTPTKPAKKRTKATPSAAAKGSKKPSAKSSKKKSA